MTDSTHSTEFGSIAQSIAPVGITMSIFTLIYSIWFGFAWGTYGWIVFAIIVSFCFIILRISIKNIKHSKKFAAILTDESKAIKKKMTVLSAITYSALWLFVIVSALFRQIPFIFPVVTLIIGIHFLPQAKIMNRKIDYFVAPIPIIFSSFTIYLAFTTEINWITLYAISGIGGCIATMTYAVYMVYSYKAMTEKYILSKNIK